MGPAAFARLPRLDQVPHADVAVVGVPFDSGAYRPGARFGPTHVRQASRLLRPYHPALDVSPIEIAQVADAGDIAVNPFNIHEAIETIEASAADLTKDGPRLVTIGGDHTIALPLLRAETSTARRIFEDDRRFGFGIVTYSDVYYQGVREVVDKPRDPLGNRPVYVSIDVLDPAHAPGTGTPEAGGVTSRELLEILRGFRGLNLIGADVVEVSPAYDHAEIPGTAASHVAFDLMSLLAMRDAERAA